MNPTLLAAGLVLATLTVPPAAYAQARRCVTADGQTIYTDRACEAFDARAVGRLGAPGDPYAPATMGVDGAVGGFAVRGCARTPDALRRGVSDALLARDVNRLANYYHWSGTGASAATALMNRLEEIASAPAGAIELVSASGDVWTAPPPPADARRTTGAAATDASPTDASASDASATDAAAPVPSGPPPVGLRVDAAGTGADGGVHATHFALRRNAGCWWIQF